jgi:hypothetical protein
MSEPRACSAIACLSAVLCAVLSAQTTVTIVLDRPSAPGDRFELVSHTPDASITLITPSGRRVTSANALAEGFSWNQRRFGATANGTAFLVSLTQPAPAGQYTLEYSSKTAGSRVATSFQRTDAPCFASAQFPGVVLNCYALPVSQPIRLALKDAPQGAVIDILASDPAASFTVALPNGRVFSAVATDLSSAPPAIAAWLFPQPGHHHLLHLDSPPPGVYLVSESAPAAGTFRAMFLPLEPELATGLPSKSAPAAPAQPVTRPNCDISLTSPHVPGRPDRQGHVIVSARTDEHGHPHDIKIIRSTNPDLERDAITYVTCRTYPPNQSTLSLELVFRTL